MAIVAKRIDLVWLDIFTRETGLTQGNMVTGDWEYDRITNSYEYVIQFDPQRPNTPRGKYALAYVTIHKETDDQGATFSHTVVDITNTDRPAANFDSTSDFQVTQSSGLTFDISSGTHTGDGLFTQAASTSAVRNTLSWSVPQGQYDVRLKRITADSSSDQVRDEVQWTALRNIKHTEPVDPTFAADKKIAQTQVIIKATDQLNGIVDQLNAVCSSILPDYEPQSGIWVERTTSNCASIAREIWQGKSSKKPVPDSRLDLDALESLWQRCNDRLMQYNGVIQGGSADDALKQVLSNARASRSLIDGIRSVVIDEEKTDVVQHFTPRNSRNFRGSKRFAEQPHALKIRFQNRAQGYAQDEVIVYDDGYSADGTDCEFNAADGSCSVATKFETMDTKGIVLGEQAHQYGRYQLAANKLRPENYSLDVDVEHLVATRGDLVRVTHDVPVFGLASGRVKSIQTSGSDTTGVTLDEELELAASTDYTMRFRLSNGDTLTRDIQQVGSDTVTGTVTFQSSIATSSGPAVGDLAMFGLIDQETVECIVKAITGGDPEWGATLELVDHAQPAIDNSADSAIPAFESNITENPFTRQIPAAPDIEEVRSDESALVRHKDGSLEETIMVSYKLPSNDRFEVDSAQFRFRKSDDNGTSWDYATGESQKGTINLAPVDTGDDYDVEARTLTRNGIAGNWVTVASAHTIVGKTTPPPDMTGLTAVTTNWVDSGSKSYGIRLTWDENPARDLSRYEIRSDTNFGSKAGLLKRPKDETAELPITAAGTYTFYGKAIDQVKLYSANATSTSITIEAPDAPSGVTATTTNKLDGNAKSYGIRLNWTNNENDFPIVRNHVYLSGQLIDSVSGTESTLPITTEGSYTFEVESEDVAGNLSSRGSDSITINPPGQPQVDEGFSGPDFKLTWSPATEEDFPVSFYEIRYGGTDFDSATAVDTVQAREIKFRADWIGSRTWRIAAYDVAGNRGASGSTAVQIEGPDAPPDLSAKVIAIDVLLNWDEVSGTLPTDRYRVYRNSDPDASFGDSGTVVQTTVDGTFASVKEDTPQDYRYWITAVDTAGNESAPSTVRVTVEELNDFVVQGRFPDDFTGGTTSDTFVKEPGVNALIGPYDVSNTVDDHYSGYSTTDDIINDGYTYVLQPTRVTTGTYQNEYDINAVLSQTLITVSFDTTVLDGDPTVSVTIEGKELEGDSYSLIANNTQGLGNQIQYIRITLTVDSDSNDDLLQITNLETVARIRKVTSEDVATADKDDEDGTLGGTAVTLDRSFLDIRAVEVSIKGNSQPQYSVFADWDDVQGQDEIHIWVYDQNGVRQTADVSYIVRGVVG